MPPITQTEFFHAFQYDSSTVDWCEPNYVMSPYIAEFFNTITSIPISLFGALHLINYHKYSSLLDYRVRIIAYLIVGVGVGSIAFHATLSTAGQLADELSILWVIALGQAWYWPKQILPKSGLIKKKHLEKVFISMAVVTTLLSHAYPSVNHIALALLGLPLNVSMSFLYISRSKRNYDSLYSQVFWSSTASWIVAFAHWITDMVFCKYALHLGIPVFHALWHVFCSVAICGSLNLLIYVDLFTNNKLKNSSVKLKRYPELLGCFAYQYLDIHTD